MFKDFSAWNTLKEALHGRPKRVYFHEGEVWWGSLGTNIGFEEDGKNEGFERPIIIFKKFNTEIFWGLPMTSKRKSGPFYLDATFADKKSTIILSQIRLLDAKRLSRKIRTLSSRERAELVSKFSSLLPYKDESV